MSTEPAERASPEVRQTVVDIGRRLEAIIARLDRVLTDSAPRAEGAEPTA